MRITRRPLLIAGPLAVLLQSCATAPPPERDASAVLAQAELATGAAKVQAIAFVSSGSGGSFGQAFLPEQPWPKMNYSRLARRMDYVKGATLVTSAMAKPYYERAFANPNRIRPDRLAKSGRAAAFIGVNGKHVFSDARRSVEVHEMQGSIHAQGLLIVYLPAERLLVQADSYTPGLYTNPAAGLVNANNQNLADNIDRLGLKIDRILPLHGRVAPLREFLATVGRGP